MNNDKTKKLDKATVSNLQSENSDLVSDTLNKLSETGNSAYIPMLIELLHSTQNNEIKRRITRLLAELKHSDAIPLIIEAIENKQYVNELQYLTSACWENGLDYINHLPVFIDLIIENDFLVAFEACTVITNMSGKISKEIHKTEAEKIKAAMAEAQEDKKQIMQDVLDFLPILEEGIEPESI